MHARLRPERWLMVLFPVYAVIVASFESTETLFSGTYYWLPHAADTRQFPHRYFGAIGERADKPHRRPGDSGAGPGRGRAGGLRALQIPFAGDRFLWSAHFSLRR